MMRFEPGVDFKILEAGDLKETHIMFLNIKIKHTSVFFIFALKMEF